MGALSIALKLHNIKSPISKIQIKRAYWRYAGEENMGRYFQFNINFFRF